MTGWLASVADEAEVALLCPARPQILDLKNPSEGALGAWPADRVAAVVRSFADVPARPRLSATVGDLPMEPAALLAAARSMAGTGVDYVKVGVAPDGDPLGCLAALGLLARTGVRLVAVFFADLWPALPPLAAAAEAGFKGAMLDTAAKGRSLRDRRQDGELAAFARQARALGLMSGLAGSLRLSDIVPLRAAGADYLGFRGALCGARDRTGAIDPSAVARVAAAMAAPMATPMIMAGPPSETGPPGTVAPDHRGEGRIGEPRA